MDGDLSPDDLEEGDCLFQPEREVFYVVTDVEEDSVNFAIHGWRSIGKERIGEYLQEDAAGDKFFITEDELREAIDEEEAERRLDRLKDMVFTVYADAEKYADPEP